MFAFDSSAGRFEGQLGGALERAESGGALRILRAIFVGRDADSGELAAADLPGRTGGLVSSLLNFRLDPESRARPSGILSELGNLLAPGEAIAAVVVEHAWAAALAGAVERTGGRPLADEILDPGESIDVAQRVLAISSRPDDRPAALGRPGC